MANNVTGFVNKRNRIAAAREKLSKDPGEYECTIIFSKGERRGVLAVWQHRLEWTVYADPSYTSHVDWNDHDCIFLGKLENTTLLNTISMIISNGWAEKSRYEH